MYIQQSDVILFVHDSAPYMGPAAERLIKELGYSNMIHLPCWAHLANIIGHVVFDKKLLPEVSSYLRLTRCTTESGSCVLTPFACQVSLCPKPILAF